MTEASNLLARMERGVWGSVDSRIYTLLRVSIVSACLVNWIALLPYLSEMFLDSGPFNQELLLGRRKYSLFAYLPNWGIELSFYLAPLVMLLALLGYFARAAVVVLWLWTLSYNNYSSLQTVGWDVVLRCALFLLVFCPLGTPLLGDRSLLGKRNGSIQTRSPIDYPRRTSPRHGLLLIQAQVFVIYLATFWHKVPTQAWRNGELMGYFFLSIYSRVGGTWVTDYPVTLAVLTYGALLTEVALPFLLVARKSRQLGLVLGLLLHGGIALTSNLSVFSLCMLSLYAAFFEASDLDRLAARLSTLRRLCKGATGTSGREESPFGDGGRV